MQIKFTPIWLILINSMVFGQSGDLPSSPKIHAFLSELDSLKAQKQIPGLAVAVLSNQKLLLAQGMGMADMKTHRLVTAATPFNIASVTKPLSATFIMQLVEQGILDLDKPMAAYSHWLDFCEAFSQRPSIFAKDLRCNLANHTLRHLLTHTATNTPGQIFSYNPVLFSYGSRPVMAVLGTSFSHAFSKNILKELHMDNAARQHRQLPLPPKIAQNLAQPHAVDENGRLGPAPLPPPQGDGAAGGVIASVLDLAKFDQALDRDQLLKPATKAQMFRAFHNHKNQAQPYAIGWYVESYKNLQLYWHSGWWEKAYSALYLKIPEKQLTLILLANSEGLWWGNPLGKAEVFHSAFAQLFFKHFL